MTIPTLQDKTFVTRFSRTVAHANPRDPHVFRSCTRLSPVPQTEGPRIIPPEATRSTAQALREYTHKLLHHLRHLSFRTLQSNVSHERTATRGAAPAPQEACRGSAVRSMALLGL